MKLIKSDIEIIEEFVNIKGQQFLDVGCGTGDLAARLKQNGAQVVGIDTPGMLGKAKNPDFLTLVAAAGEYLPFATGKFDCITYMASLHHIPPEKMNLAITEAHRVLNERGSALVIEPVVRPGAYTEITHLADDETEMLAAAYQAIETSEIAGFSIESERLYYFERSFEDYRNIVQIFIDDEKRESILVEAEEITKKLAADSDISFEEFRYPSICRVNLLKKSN